MADVDYFTDIDSVRASFASDLFNNRESEQLLEGISQSFIQDNLIEIQYQSTTSGPDLLCATLYDPAWVILDSRLADITGEGIYDLIDINFPHGTDCWWRLNLVTNQAADMTAPNVQLQFQHRPVSYLQADWGPLAAAPGTKTRAQFVKQLVDRVPGSIPNAALGPGSDRSQQIQLVIPELNVIQPLAPGSAPKDKTTVTKKTNKSKGVSKAAAKHLTVQGQTMTKAQIQNANTALDEADSLNAPEIVMVAMMYGAMGETGLGANVNTYSGPSYGVFQTSAGDYSQGEDLTGQSKGWLTGGPSFSGSGGALAVYKTNPTYDAWQIANDTERNKVWNTSGGDSYAHEFPGGQSAGIIEAHRIVDAYGGGSDGTIGSTSVTTVTSDVGSLQRGVPGSNPDEDSWSCLQRLAQAVNWELYTSAHPAPGQWGNYLYYMTGPRNDKQMPAAYITRSQTNPGTWDLERGVDSRVTTATNVLLQQPGFTVDNSAFQYKVTKKKHGKVQQKIVKYVDQTATNVEIELRCDPMEYNAGDVVYFDRSGPINGRWLVATTERNIVADDFDTITLAPPTAPNPEPTITTTTSTTTSANSKVKTGTLAKVADLATRAAALESEKHCYSYTEGTGRTNDGHGVLSAPFTYDCSGFADGCYNAAGLPDPGGDGSYSANSYAIAAHCTSISRGDAKPGDLAIFDDPGHVVVWIGNGQCVSMGQQGEPKVVALQDEIDAHGVFDGFYRVPGVGA